MKYDWVGTGELLNKNGITNERSTDTHSTKNLI